MGRLIYLDNAATTPVKEEVIEAMMPFFKDCYGNPSAVYGLGTSAAQSVNKSRGVIASFLNAKTEEIFFTSGGTESDNWALRAVCQQKKDLGNHLIVSKVEHHAIINTCKELEKNGISVTYLDVDSDGRVNPSDVKKAIRPETILISVMMANNEVGTIMPILKIGQIAHERGILFHTDAVQAFGHIPINVQELNIDLLSASAHKLNGPKGVGLLYVNRSVRLTPLLFGGSQERGRRAGTLNVPGIVGFAEAIRLSEASMETDIAKQIMLRNHLINRITTEIDNVFLSGSIDERLPGNAHFCFEGVDSEALVLMLGKQGICVSGGAACTTGDNEPSHVLHAMGIPGKLAKGALRVSLCADNNLQEIDEAVEEIKKIVGAIRRGRI